MFPDLLTTARLLLRPIVAGDAQAIFEGYAQDAEVTRYLSWRPHASIEDSRRFVDMCLTVDSSRTYLLVLRTTGRVIGVFDLRRKGPDNLEFGYALARAMWGQGLMTEALVEVVDWALRQPAIARIGAVADAENIASQRVMEKAGLRREAVLRGSLAHPNVGDALRDGVTFAAYRSSAFDEIGHGPKV